MKNYQVTMYCENGKYKPVSTIVKFQCENEKMTREEKQEIVNQGIVAICNKRYWTKNDVKKYGYTKVKVRAAV